MSTLSADWPQWRGPDGTGVAETAAPTEWGDDQNVKWRIEVPGRGCSTPIIVGDRVYLTTAVEQKSDDDPERGILPHAFMVMALDRETGATVWDTTVFEGTPHEGFHKTYGSFASASPTTDGERLYVSFGSNGVYALDFDGEVLWSFEPGVELEMRRQFGEGSAPAVHGNTLVHLYDHEGPSFVVALDASTGKEKWRRDRDEPSTWAMPLFIEDGDDVLAVTSGTNRIRAYELESGEIRWECGGLGLNAIPAPMKHGNTVIAMSGYKNPKIQSVTLGSEGDLTGSDAVVWSAVKGAPYTASGVLHDGKLFLVTDRGFASCYDAATGEEHYVEERLPRGSQLKASPVVAGGLLYVPCESGEVHLLSTDGNYSVVGTNTLEGQMFVASPAVANGELFLRSMTHLYCIAEEEAE